MEYVAPELEVVSTVVESGFAISGIEDLGWGGGIDDATENDCGGF